MPSNNQAVYQPLNGLEIRKILKKRVCERIDLIPRMKEGHAYHEANLAFSFTMTATPADCPVPTAEFEEAMKAPEFNLQKHWMEVTDKATSLKNVKEQMLAHINKINGLLETIEQITEDEEIISAGRVPDQIRIDNGLPVPRIVKEETPTGGTKMTEKMIDYSNL